MLFSQATVSFDASKSFNGHSLLMLAAIGICITIVCNIPLLYNWFQAWKNRQVVNVVDNLPPLMPTNQSHDEPPTEAEYRVMLFGWVDEIRSYAVETGNDKALATANTLINDLLATVPKKEANNAVPTITT